MFRLIVWNFGLLGFVCDLVLGICDLTERSEVMF